MSGAPLAGGDIRLHLGDVLAAAGPGGLAAGLAGNGSAHGELLRVIVGMIPGGVYLRPAQVDSTVVTTVVTDGARGVEENPKRHGGSTRANSPRSTPSKRAVSEVTARRSVAAYHSRRPGRAIPRVRTPRSATRTIGSTALAQAGLVATT